MRLRESGNIGVSGNDAETTGTMRRGVVKSWSQLNKASGVRKQERSSQKFGVK